jgi:PKD repeat protein
MTYNTVGTNTVSLTVSGPLGTNKLTRTNYIVVTNALVVLASNSIALVAETCTNGVVDAGESITMNFSLKNIGTASTTNLIATLQASGGITAPSGPQNYGALAGGAVVTRPFSFIPTGACGTTNLATLQLQDGSSNYGTVSFGFILGQPGMVFFTQNFDGVTAPALPAGWTTATAAAGVAWQTTTSPVDTVPNSAFSPSASSTGLADLVSAPISLPGGAVQLSFRHRFDMESTFDGGVLEIKIGAAAFSSFTAVGGVFVSNGYNATIDTGYGNPLAGQPSWTGGSGGFITTIANLPPAASGQNIQFRWRCGSDSTFAGAGWYIDTIALSAYQCCANPPVILVQPQNQTVLLGDTANFSVSAGGTPPFTYQWRFNGTNLPGANATNLTRVNVQPVDVGNYTAVVSNSVNSVTSSIATLRIVTRPILVVPKYTNGAFQFTLSGNGGYNYLVEGSTNLSTWTTITTVTNPSGQVQFTDPAATNFLFRFYRARLVP